MAVKDYYHDLDVNQNNIIAPAIDPVPADPATPVAGQMWFNTTDGVLRVYDGAEVCDLACRSDLTQFGRHQGQYDASGGTVPTSGNFAATSADIEAGDRWVIDTAGTIPGLAFGNTALEVGDEIVALVDNASAPGDFYSVETNKPVATTASCEQQTQNLVANTPLSVTFSTLVNVCSVTAYDSAGNEISLCVVRTGANAFDVESNVALTGVSLDAVGTI